jgi:hypothetical protein
MDENPRREHNLCMLMLIAHHCPNLRTRILDDADSVFAILDIPTLWHQYGLPFRMHRESDSERSLSSPLPVATVRCAC